MTEDMAVALDALMSDAAVWDQAADNLTMSQGIVAPLSLSAKDVMSYASARGFDRRYEEMRAKLDQLLTQGSDNFRSISDRLVHAREIYEREEAENVGRIGNLGGN